MFEKEIRDLFFLIWGDFEFGKCGELFGLVVYVRFIVFIRPKP